MNKLSFIIPTFNACATIDRCIASIMCNANGLPFEIVIVDDGSTDDTLRQIESKFMGLTILRNPGRGPFSARLAGIKNATGSYLFFADADDYYTSESSEYFRLISDEGLPANCGCEVFDYWCEHRYGFWEQKHAPSQLSKQEYEANEAIGTDCPHVLTLLWNKVFRKEWLEIPENFENIHLFYGEDRLATLYWLANRDGVVRLYPRAIYRHTYSVNGLSNSLSRKAALSAIGFSRWLDICETRNANLAKISALYIKTLLFRELSQEVKENTWLAKNASDLFPKALVCRLKKMGVFTIKNRLLVMLVSTSFFSFFARHIYKKKASFSAWPSLEIIMGTCDKYACIQKGFLHFYNLTSLGSKNGKIYSIGSKNLSLGSTLLIGTKGNNDALAFSTRLARTLKSINSQYVLFFLDDFYYNRFEPTIIQRALCILEHDESVGCIILRDFQESPHLKPYMDDDSFFIFEKQNTYLITTQTAVWKKAFLQKMLCRGENAWQFELNGTERARLSDQKILYCLNGDRWIDLPFGGVLWKGVPTKEGEKMLKRAGISTSVDFSVNVFKQLHNNNILKRAFQKLRRIQSIRRINKERCKYHSSDEVVSAQMDAEH